ncbi:zinc finger protein 239-like [Cheilinus undulatus]|uniref:zinc finger protein 239-like n=1 Tax=Cheilinus undulatus TaxID=241271 RepID=UPI001BD2C10E|nr:zinc finger protein 239-like [Cheilinus undulatus]
MFSVERFKGFVHERLTAAAEEIWDVFSTAVVEYEAEINRQRRMLDIVWKPHIHLHRIDVPQQHVCKEEEEVGAEQQLCHQERKSSLDQEEPEPPQIKEEQEGEQLKREETDTMLAPTQEEGEHREADGQHELQLLSCNSYVAENQDPKENKQKDSEITGNSKPRQEKDRKHTDVPHQQPCHQERKSCLDQEEPEPPQMKEEQEGEQIKKEETDMLMLTPTQEEGEHREADGQHEHQLLSCNSHVAENQDPKENKQKDSEVTGKSEPRQERDRKHTDERMHSCESLGKRFKYNFVFKQHMRTRTGGKPFSCSTCEKKFSQKSNFTRHILTHTGTKLYTCDTCGTSFTQKYNLDMHVKIHTDEKPHTCTICTKSFRRKGTLTVHVRRHTGEKPFSCSTCGKRFCQKSEMNKHILIHTGTKPYTCGTCGTSFTQKYHLDMHVKIHTGEKPHTCTICNKSFRQKSTLTVHMKRHTGEKPCPQFPHRTTAPQVRSDRRQATSPTGSVSRARLSGAQP